jgi:hypothetical protein
VNGTIPKIWPKIRKNFSEEMNFWDNSSPVFTILAALKVSINEQGGQSIIPFVKLEPKLTHLFNQRFG